jgi:amino acid/amide ABC transporter membrane protein 1, HAAT family (TC 3.A.1.4.-)
MAVLEYLANGLVFSSIIVLASIGLSLIYSIARFANFAHGDTMTVGAYGAFVGFALIGDLGPTVLGLPVGFYLAVAVGATVAAVVAVLTQRLVYDALEIGAIGLLITSIGVAFVYRAVVILAFGTGNLRYTVPAQRPIPALVPVGVRVTTQEVAIVAVALMLVIGLHLLLRYTLLGRMMRATADNADLAQVTGIRTARITRWTWVIGAGLAGVGGVFLGLYNQVEPRMGFNILLVVFAAVILGGIGSVYGAMLGGFLIGMIDQLTPLLGDVGIPIGTEYSYAIAFVIMVVVLLVRPRGIAGGDPG